MLLLVGLHPLDLTWLSWVAFLPLFILFLNPACHRSQLLLCALLVGIIYYGVGLYWLLYFDARIYALAFLIVAPSFAIYFFVLNLATSRIASSSLKILAAPIFWILIQKIYALSLIGTIATEVPFYGALPFFQVASVTGFITVPAVIMGLNMAGAALLKKRVAVHIAWLLFFIMVLAGIYFWGEKQLREAKPKEESQFALVQGNFPVSGKWRLEHPIYIRAEYRRLALEAAKKSPSMIIFPLYSFPDDALRNPEFFTGLALETKTWILVATYIPQKAGESIAHGFFDAALLYSPSGKLVDYYQAVQAPPFRHVSESTGKEYKVLQTPFGKLGILLCYEDSLPKMAKKAVQNGADILVALSNPGQFNSTHMPYYHLMQDRLRAIESNRWLVRASANGYSAVIDPNGRFVQRSELNKQEILQIKVGKNQAMTFYHSSFDWLAFGSVLICILFFLSSFKIPKLVSKGLAINPKNGKVLEA